MRRREDDEMDEIRAEHISPCAMDCRLCSAYMRKKNPCGGCNVDDPLKPASCQHCVIKHCAQIEKSSSGLCFECERFPCRRLIQLDARYRGKYHMSMIGNLEFIRDNGMEAFLFEEKRKWTCVGCGNILSVHKPVCTKCGLPLTATIGEE